MRIFNKRIGQLTFVLFLLISCGNNEVEKVVTLQSLHKYYIALAKEIPDDIISSCEEQNSLRNILNKSYITPKIHSSIMGVWGSYANTCQIIENELGEIKSYELTKIIEGKLLYHFYYDLKTSRNEEKVTLKLVMNKNYGLSEFHIYTYSGPGIKNILFPK